MAILSQKKTLISIAVTLHMPVKRIMKEGERDGGVLANVLMAHGHLNLYVKVSLS